MENGEVIEHQQTAQDQPTAESVVEDMQQTAQDVQEDSSGENTEETKMVPLSALQKERKKRQEAEMNATWQQQQLEKLQNSEPEDDSYKYESATREDVMKAQQEAIRMVEEKRWIKENNEKFELLNEKLPNFLKQKPNLVAAIDAAENRYEEAYTLMTKLNAPPVSQQKAPQPRGNREAPNSPSTVPKTAAMNTAVDVMSMSDTEFKEWRNGLKSRRRAY